MDSNFTDFKEHEFVRLGKIVIENCNTLGNAFSESKTITLMLIILPKPAPPYKDLVS